MKLHNTLILFLIWALIILFFFNDNIFFLNVPFGCTFRPAWSFLMVSYSFHNLDFFFILSIKPSILYLIIPIWNLWRSYSILFLLLLMCFCWLLFHLASLYLWEYWGCGGGSWGGILPHSVCFFLMPDFPQHYQQGLFLINCLA